ncbi:hypothetical protein [Methanofollis sp. UBA420]|uniref:hypothetical protein n=1 Tax=Methanofollis sp. UBA420 TaxID=1915514 RepID=UPI00316AE5D9
MGRAVPDADGAALTSMTGRAATSLPTIFTPEVGREGRNETGGRTKTLTPTPSRGAAGQRGG